MIGDDIYESAFDPREYLRQYYSLPRLAADDADLMRALTGWLREAGRVYPEAIDLGCGPTLHNSFAIAPYAERIDLADFLPANLAEARRWLVGDPDAHDWDALFRGVLECDGVGPECLTERKRLFRSRVRGLLHCDLRRPHPLGEPASYDLVTSFFCAECVATTGAEWRAMMVSAFDLVRQSVRRGGRSGGFFLASVRNATSYSVLGRRFPTVPVNEDDLREVFAEGGFDPALTVIEVFAAPDWADDGFDSICVTRARYG